MSVADSCHAQQLDRRQLLQSVSCGFASVALQALLAETSAADFSSNAPPTAVPGPVLTPRAKRIIFIFMQGGP
ncbi:MAG: hypothetical protein ACKO2L_09940, partial [Planctomycetaceae bacterium]